METDDQALTVTMSSVGGTTTIAAAGDIDMGTCDTLEEHLGQALDGGEEIDLDLAEVEFMDSTGISCLLHLRARAQEQNVAVRLVSASPAVERILHLSGLGDLFA
ncbi:MAG: STAS domain-containing protein [Acidimicrobiia bacterium]|nr:STAS domain-containing protein [Acidimicrobiia bacterium]